MSLMTLLVAVFATCMIVYLIQQGSIPAPFHWIAVAVCVLIWLFILISVSGMSSHLRLG